MITTYQIKMHLLVPADLQVNANDWLEKQGYGPNNVDIPMERISNPGAIVGYGMAGLRVRLATVAMIQTKCDKLAFAKAAGYQAGNQGPD